MPNPLLTRLTNQLKAKGVKDAGNMAFGLLRKRGHIKANGDLTYKGKVRSDLGDGGRAKDRAAKASGRKAGEFKYNPKTNRATLKKHGR